MERDLDLLKMQILQRHSDSRYCVPMPFNVSMLCEALDEYANAKNQSQEQTIESEDDTWKYFFVKLLWSFDKYTAVEDTRKEMMKLFTIKRKA